MAKTGSSHTSSNRPRPGDSEIQQLLQALLSHSFDAIIAINPGKKIIYFNQQAESLLGYTTSEMIGHSVTRLYQDITQAEEIYDRIQAQRAVEQEIVTLRHKNGSEIPVLLFGKRVDRADGQALGQVGYFRRSSEIQSLEKQLQALIETSKAITSTSKLEQILQSVVASTLQAIPAGDRCAIHFYNEQSNKLELMVPSFDYSNNARNALSFDVGEGIAGWVFEHQESVNCGDVLADERYKKIDDTEVESHRSILCVPISGQLRKIGVMNLCNSTTPDAFKLADLDLLTGFADLAAVAIENSEHLNRITKETSELEFLHNASLKINAQTKIEDILTAILESGIELLGVEMAVVHWKGNNTKGMQTFVVPKELESLRSNPREEEGLTAEVFRSGEPVVIPLTMNDSRVNPSVVKAGIQSLVGYPLKLGDRVAGALFFNSRKPQHFGEHERHLISLLLPLAATAIENADIIEHLERSRHLSESLVQVSSKLSATHNLDGQVADLKVFLRDELAAPMIFLGLVNEISHEIELKIFYENNQDQELFSIPLKGGGETISTYLIKHKKPLLWFSEQQKQSECQRLGINPLQKGLECRTCLAFPLEVMDKVLGVIAIQSPEQFAWNEIEVSILQALAHQASLAIRNSKLYYQVNKAHATTKLVAQITALGNLNYTLESIVYGVKDVLECDIVTLYTYREKNERFDSPPAVVGKLKNRRLVVAGDTVDRSAAPYKIIDLNDLYYSEDSQNDPILGTPFAKRENVNCTVASPLKAHDRRVGVLFINYCNEHRLTEEELDDIRLFSSLAAVAISNAMLYEDEQDRRKALKIIDAAGRAVTSSLQLDDVCYELAHQAYDLTGKVGEKALFASIAQVEGNQVILMAAYPQGELENIMWAKAAEVNLESGVDGKIGIIGRAVKNKKPLLVKNVIGHRDFISSNPYTKCELVVPICYQNEVVGVINVEHRLVGGLDEEDEQDLQALAAYAAIALENAKRYQELKDTQATVGNITAVAWMGLVAGAWRHSIGNMATTISDLSLLAQIELVKGEPVDKITQRLVKIQDIVKEIQQIPMPPLSSEASMEALDLYQLTRDRVNQFKSKERFDGIEFEILPETAERMIVRASPEWLRRILDILIDNAKNAIRNSEIKKISINLVLKDEGVEISVTDTGSGIPKHIQAIMFKRPIPKAENEKGSGLGLYLANTVIQLYGGWLKLYSTGLDGTTMAIWLPLLNPRGAS